MTPEMRFEELQRRLTGIEEVLRTHIHPNGSSLGRLEERQASTQRELSEVRQVMVTKAEFAPVRAVIYGMVGTILLAVIGALLAIVVRGQ